MNIQITPDNEITRLSYQQEITRKRQYVEEHLSDKGNRENDLVVINQVKQEMCGYFTEFGIDLKIEDMPEVYIVRPDQITSKIGKQDFFEAILEHGRYSLNHYDAIGHYTYIIREQKNEASYDFKAIIAHELFHSMGAKLITANKIYNGNVPRYYFDYIYGGFGMRTLEMWDGNLLEEGLATRTGRKFSTKPEVEEKEKGYRDAEIIINKIIADGERQGINMEQLLYRAHFDVREGSALIAGIDSIYGEGTAYKLLKRGHERNTSYQFVIDSLVPAK